ncbi:hypothetical protein [uncultured Roseovarius sp.]|uniref:hypothetical protein n=1 Tax=uncultured Roseovarius sp. TaxID=293344 RepID=UPI0025D76381|nr:hypothetical protein [uncultured Roseovarius sp.]
MTNNNDLDRQLQQLEAAAQSQTAAYESSRNQLYQNIVDAYLWWRAAEQQGDYLKQLYDERGIRTRRKPSNQPNFYPLVRMIWQMDVKKHASTISNWSKSLLALHETYAEKPHLFSNDARTALINHIHDMGGLGELRGERRMTAQELADEEEAADFEEQDGRGRKTGSTGNAAVFNNKVEHAKSVKPKASLPAFASAVTNSDDFVVMLARRNNETGELEVVGSNYTDDLIDTALLACTDIDRAGVTPSLRLIAEALQPHTVPAPLEKYRKRFFDLSSTVTRTDRHGKTVHVPCNTTLLVRPAQKDIVVTKTPYKTTAVTHVIPKRMQLHDGNSLVLRGSDRSWIERELINSQKLSLYTAEPKDRLIENSTDRLTRYSLHLNSEATHHKRSIYFYDCEEMPEESIVGMMIDPETRFKSSWRVTANAQWFAEFDANCVQHWITRIRSFFNKPQSRKIALHFSESSVRFDYWWDAKNKSFSEQKQFELGKAAQAKISTSTPTINLYPKDAMLLFSAIATLPLDKHDIVMRGNASGMMLEYETDLARYQSYLPAYEQYTDLPEQA